MQYEKLSLVDVIVVTCCY